MTLEFRVNGVAQQAGSKRAFVPKGWTRPVITDTNRNLKSWQQLVAEAANHAIQQLPVVDRALGRDPVRLTIAIAFPRPQSLPKRRTAHTTRPDLDKCVRSIQDALTQVVYHDDGQISELVAAKRYAAIGEVPHVDIRLEPASGLAPAVGHPLLEAFV